MNDTEVIRAPNRLKADYLLYIEAHRYLPDYVKDLCKQIVSYHFSSLGMAIANIELAVRRTEQLCKEQND